MGTFLLAGLLTCVQPSYQLVVTLGTVRARPAVSRAHVHAGFLDDLIFNPFDNKKPTIDEMIGNVANPAGFTDEQLRALKEARRSGPPCHISCHKSALRHNSPSYHDRPCAIGVSG